MLCEKPLANTVAEARAMVEAARAARAAGVRSMVGFNYRRVPAVTFARQLVADGRIGTVRHVRAQYLQDWIVDPEFPLVWRLRAEEAGSGALGDIGAHIVDLTQFVTGQRLTGVNALLETFVRERPLPGASSGLSATGGSGRGRGHRRRRGALRRPARRRRDRRRTRPPASPPAGKNAIRVEVNGSAGSLAFDLERLNELELLRRHRGPGGRRASGGSWSPSRPTRTSARGGRPGTRSAGPRPSPTR